MKLSPRLVDDVRAFSASGADHFPNELVASLKSGGFFSLLLPTSLGGPDLSLPAYLQLIKTLSGANGSVGWCVNQGSVLASLARLLPTESANAIFVKPDITLANGPPRQCETKPVKGGFELTGSWHFSSGIEHADWLLGMAPLREAGKTRGMLWHFFPKAHATITRDWNVQGLRATNSFEFSVTNYFVPADRAIEPLVNEDDAALYQVPLNLLFACGFAGVALGVARAALDAASGRAVVKVRRFEKQSMAEDQMTQDQIGNALAIHSAAECYLDKTVADTWQHILDTGSCVDDQRMKLRLATTHVIRESRRVSNIAWDVCSTDSIFTSDPVHRLFQDSHVISQHLQGRPEVYSLAGRHQLGLPVSSVLL